MFRRSFAIVAIFVAAVGAAALAAVDQKPPAQKPGEGTGWQLPPDADEKKNPVAADTKALATGKVIFKDKCSKCHGNTGLGDGPDADPDHQEHMNLTNPKFADRNTDGVVFYKVSNGRRRPKMPAFKEELTEQQIWSVVTYVQTLRKK
ncbi:MAG TPA: c-type cytochrome [Vicinamibacterales bacterium]|jgi:mono/diheme cytochrome c family protein